MKHTYKIVFNKKKENWTGYSWEEVASNYLTNHIISYCASQQINIKKLIIKDAFSYSHLTVKCIKADYLKLVSELCQDRYHIDLYAIGL